VEPQVWVAIILGIMSILGGLFAVVKFIVRAIMAEIGPQANGSSIRMQVNRIEDKMSRLEQRLDAILLER
jgi:hypothetical protein